jgi:23S rRNA pseudouridine2604 synthase
MATLKIKKTPGASPKTGISRAPVRGAGSGVRKRPTLAEAQAERERREKEREERWQEQLHQRYGNQAPPRFGQRRQEGNAFPPARQRPAQRQDWSAPADPQQRASRDNDRGAPRRPPSQDDRRQTGRSTPRDQPRNVPGNAFEGAARPPRRDDMRGNDPRNNMSREAPRHPPYNAQPEPAHRGSTAFDRHPRDRDRMAPPAQAPRRNTAFEDRGVRDRNARGFDDRNNSSNNRTRSPAPPAFEPVHQGRRGPNTEGMANRHADNRAFDSRRQPPRHGEAAPPRQRLAPAMPTRHRHAEEDFDDVAERQDAQGSMRLSKRMSELGIASRREADEWIEKGWVRVDGRVVSELGSRVLPEQQITVDAKAKYQQAQKVTVLINKPVGYVSGQAEDGYEPAVVLVTPDNQWREDQSGTRFLREHTRSLVPAGRLDIDSVGLLVLTQDGRVAKQLIGEDSDIEKEYLVRVASADGKSLSDSDLALLNHGLELDGEPLREAKVEWANEDQLRFVLKEGKKRQIRRMCEAVGLQVLGLKRVRIGKVMLGDLPPGQWRYLRSDESFA